jgi:muramoyltetrapeptide carboxypeptidase
VTLRATRFGRPLPDGGCIGVAAPSSPWFNRSDVLRGVEWWEAKGYRVRLAPHVWDRDDYSAGSAEARAEDLLALFADGDVDVVQCLQGGYGAMEVLPHLDAELIRANPKAVCGYSDITALHMFVLSRCELATVHSNGLAGVGAPEIPDWNRERLLSVLRDGGTGEVPRDPDDPYVRPIAAGRVTAPVAGGNLDLIERFIGTAFQPSFDGNVLLIEDVDSTPWEIDSKLLHLSQAGVFDGVSGVVVGEMKDCDWRESRPEVPRTRSLEDVLERHLEPLGVPVLYKLPLGHGKHHAAIPLGVTATLDADARTFAIDEPGLRP